METAQLLPIYFPLASQNLRTSSHLVRIPNAFGTGLLLYRLRRTLRLPTVSHLFFSFLQRKEKNQNLPAGRQGKRRLLPHRSARQKVSSTLVRSSLCSYMALASFLSSTRWCSWVPCQLLFFYWGHANHIYGNMKAPSRAERICIIKHFVAPGTLDVASGCTYFFVLECFGWFMLIISCLCLLRVFIASHYFPFTSHLLPKTCALLLTCFQVRSEIKLPCMLVCAIFLFFQSSYYRAWKRAKESFMIVRIV